MVAQKSSGKPNSVADGARDVANGAKNAARSAKNNPWIDRLTRIGYATRGLIYGLMGYLAFQVFFGRGKITDQTGALATIAAQPYGKVLMIVIAVGLVGLLIWGIVRGIADPYHKGSDLKGMISRAGYIVSGISYGALLMPTLQLIRGASRGSSTQQTQQAAAGMLTKPWGPWVIGLVGLVLMGAGLYRMYLGVKGKLTERLKSYEMTEAQRKWAVRLGRIGYIALGFVLTVTGGLAVLAATTFDPHKIGGLDSALVFIAHQPYGPWLLALVGLGLIAFAIYSFMGAIWFRIKEL